MTSGESSSAPPANGKRSGRGAPRSLPIINPDVDDAIADTALNATLPEPVLVLSPAQREGRVRQGLDTVMLDDVDATGGRRTRGFVKAVLRVPLNHPAARVYGVFIEVDRDAYVGLRRAFAEKTPTEVKGRLATRLPFLDDAYGTDVVVREDGSDARARVVEVASPLLRDGPTVGPRVRRA